VNAAGRVTRSDSVTDSEVRCSDLRLRPVVREKPTAKRNAKMKPNARVPRAASSGPTVRRV